MSNISETLNAIKATNTIYNTQITSLLKTAQDDINQIVLKTQTDLINRISQDYNISVRELTRKYITKPKKTRKSKDDIDDSPTMQTINDSKNADLSDDDSNISNLMVKNNSSQQSGTSETAEPKNTQNEIAPEHIEVPETVFKTVKIKNIDYLLNITTNEIFDMENNLVGRKNNNKYMMNMTKK